MTHIKIEVPANDHIALSAMAEALNRIAAERAPSVSVVEPSVTDLCEKPFGIPTREDIQRATARLAYNGTFGGHTDPYAEQVDLVKPVHVEIARTDVEFEEVVESINNIEPTPTEQDDTLDADGLPWDNRIHSRGKTRLSDDTWRLARKPNDKTDEEWSTYVESVKSELKAVQDIPSVVDELPAISIEDITQAEINAGTLDEQAVADLTPPIAPVTPPTSLTPPIAPVTPPTSVTPPVVESVVEAPVTSNQPSVTTFQELMLYITGNAKKRGADNELIKSTLLEVDPALVAIPLIATRADLIPKFVTALEAKLS